MQRRRITLVRRLRQLTLASLGIVAVSACNPGGESELDVAIHEEYGALEARDAADDVTARERDDGDRELFPTVCRELISEARVVERERETTRDGRDVRREDGDANTDGRGDRVSVIRGERTDGRRVWFARLDEQRDDGSRRRALLAGEARDDGRVSGRVLDRQRHVRGLFIGERDGDGNLRLRIRLACRDLLNEGEREEHDEDNDRVRDAVDRVESGDAERPVEDDRGATSLTPERTTDRAPADEGSTDDGAADGDRTDERTSDRTRG